MSGISARVGEYHVLPSRVKTWTGTDVMIIGEFQVWNAKPAYPEGRTITTAERDKMQKSDNTHLESCKKVIVNSAQSIVPTFVF